jgi:hypothetical protein
MSEVMPAAIVERRCRIEEVFDAGFIELLRLVPRNPHVRALILRLTSKMPGPTCGTFEEIKEWVETHCEKRVPIQGRTRGEAGIEITVDFSETEYGRAHYSVSRSGQDEFHLGADDLLQMVQNALGEGEGLEGVIDAIAGRIDDDAWSQCEPNLDDADDYDYSDHEETSSDSSRTSYSKDQIRRAVLAFLRERHPHLAAEL